MDRQTIEWMMDRWDKHFNIHLFDISSFSRLIAPVNTNDDHNLDQPLYQLYGMSSTETQSKLFSFSTHNFWSTS